jgi:polyisoprenoid-binding protein YceI
MNTPQPTEPATSSARRVPRWAKWTVIGTVAAVVLFFGAVFLYAKVINDSPEKFTSADIDAALTAAAQTGAAGEPGGNWVTNGVSQVGYRVQEVLFGVDTTAVGRSDEVTGTMAIDGESVTATEFSVEVATITSDESRRDGQFRGRIMSANEFPTATFVLTQPIDLGRSPDDGASVTTTATGDLTLRGVTRPVTFDVIARQQDGRIGVQGSIPIVFADYSIANPSGGGVSTEDHGLVEFVLVFEPA